MQSQLGPLLPFLVWVTRESRDSIYAFESWRTTLFLDVTRFGRQGTPRSLLPGYCKWVAKLDIPELPSLTVCKLDRIISFFITEIRSGEALKYVIEWISVVSDRNLTNSRKSSQMAHSSSDLILCC